MSNTRFLICALFITACIALVKAANILVIFPSHCDSHYRVYSSFFEELARRGHNIDVLSHFPRKEALKGFTDISLKGSIPVLRNLDVNIKSSFLWNEFNSIFKITGVDTCTGCMNSLNAKELRNSSKKYDLIISQIFISPCMLGYVEIFKVPLILVGSTLSMPWTSEIVGLRQNPSYIPLIYTPYTENMNFFQRMHNAVLLVMSKIWYHFVAMTQSNKYYKDFFGKDFPDVSEVMRKTSMVMVNSHFSLHQSRPVPPNFIEIAGIHIKPNATLPKTFKKHLRTNLKGIIYLSFGTYFNTDAFPEIKLKALLESLEKLPYKIIWKGDKLKFPKHLTISDNIQFIPWLPQLELLCNPNIKLFITHGGLASVLEAVHCGTPMLVLPVWSDQVSNANLVGERGIGKTIPFSEITAKKLSEGLEEMIKNPEYTSNIKMISERFRDRPISAMETAVFWTEYVIRHKGAPQLRSKSTELPWYAYYCLDVAFVLLLSITFTVYCLHLVFKVFSCKLTKIKVE